MSSGPELHERQLRILRLLRECTARGLITWQPGEDDPDHYRTTSGPWAGYIQFKWVAFHGESGSDRDFVEVGHAGHHMAGTPGWWLTLEILAAGDVAYWRNHNQQPGVPAM